MVTMLIPASPSSNTSLILNVADSLGYESCAANLRGRSPRTRQRRQQELSFQSQSGSDVETTFCRGVWRYQQPVRFRLPEPHRAWQSRALLSATRKPFRYTLNPDTDAGI